MQKVKTIRRASNEEAEKNPSRTFKTGGEVGGCETEREPTPSSIRTKRQEGGKSTETSREGGYLRLKNHRVGGGRKNTSVTALKKTFFGSKFKMRQLMTKKQLRPLKRARNETQGRGGKTESEGWDEVKLYANRMQCQLGHGSRKPQRGDLTFA